MMRRFAAIGLMSAVVSLAAAAAMGQAERPRSHAPRTPWGAPDLNGHLDGFDAHAARTAEGVHREGRARA